MNINRIFIFLLALSVLSCNEKTNTPESEGEKGMSELNISDDFNWSASKQGELIITLDNPHNVSTEREYIQIINSQGTVIDREVVASNTATFNLILPEDGDYYVYYPVTTDKVKIEEVGPMTIELGPTVKYIYSSTKSTQVVSCTSCDTPIVNGGGEDPYLNSGFRIYNEDEIPGWETTATDNKIEVWVNGFQGVPAQEGRQFYELNANQVAALYQELCLEPGSIIYWSVWHRGRSGVDVAEVKIGATVETAESQSTMTDGTGGWGYYSGTYNVPADQTSTFFVFESVSSASSSQSVGNFLDNFEISCDADGDGVIDRYDDFPGDPNAAFLSYFPEDGKQVVAFEDLWPSLGDFDFNDLVMSNKVKISKNTDGDLIEANFKVSIDAVGASLYNGIAMMIYDENSLNFSNNIIESVSGDVSLDPDNTNGLILTNDIFETINNRYQNNGTGPMGIPDTLRFTIVFNDNADSFIPELYLFRTDVRSHEVHRSGFPYTATIDANLYNTIDDAGDYKTTTGLPWGMEIITDGVYSCPREKVDILYAYPKFEAWATSNGVDEPTWYLEPDEDKVVEIIISK